MMSIEKETREIKSMVEQGKITPQEGQTLLEALRSTDQPARDQAAASRSQKGHTEQDILTHTKKWWLIPAGLGVLITLLGGALLFWSWSARGFGALFVLSWIPFWLGIGLLILGWNSRTGPWLHIRIRQKPGEKPERIHLSLPLPLRLAGWITKLINRFAPQEYAVHASDLMLALDVSAKENQPVQILVDEDTTGEHVEIIIG